MPFYWERHPDGPLATFIAIVTTYLDPEIYDLESLTMLKALAQREDREEMRVFKSEFRDALRDPGLLPRVDEFEECYWCLEEDEGGAEAFLWRLWRELYGDELSGAEAGVAARISALPDRFARRLDSHGLDDVSDAARAGEPAEALDVLIAGLINGKIQVTQADVNELDALASGVGMRIHVYKTTSGTLSSSRIGWRLEPGRDLESDRPLHVLASGPASSTGPAAPHTKATHPPADAKPTPPPASKHTGKY